MTEQSFYVVDSETCGEGPAADGTFEVFNSASIDVPIRWDPSDGHLTRPDPRNIKFRGVGRRVEWNFRDVPVGYQPIIIFVRYKPLDGEDITDKFYNPFDKMILSDNKIVCKRQCGPVGTYWWKVLLVPKDGDPQNLKWAKCRPYIEGQDGGGIELTGEPT